MNIKLSMGETSVTQRPLTSYIQSTLIGPSVTRAEIVKHVETCAEYKFNAAMIAPCWVPLASEILAGTGVRVATFIDFGMGNASIEGKAALIKDCVRLGADEVDYAPNMGYLLSEMYSAFQQEALALVEAANGMPIKAMLQIGMLAAIEEKRRAINLLEEARVDWVKNSSGGWPPGSSNANVEDISLIANTVKGYSKVKASGGIHDAATAHALIEAGAQLLGTSHGVEIVEGIQTESASY